MSRAIARQPASNRAGKRAPTIRAAADYLALVKAFPLRPIRNEAEYDLAAEMLDRLVTRIDLTPGETDYMEMLTLSVQAYDDEHNDPELASDLAPLEVLRFLMDQHSMSTTDLGEVLGSKGVASEVLHGKRDLSKGHISKLAERFAVDPGVFLERPSRHGTTSAFSRPSRIKAN